ncbi:MAG TPA: ATP-binding protein [Bacteroidia bacterium]|nr:ATP-binding protein [Bacteroidia bacterium]
MTIRSRLFTGFLVLILIFSVDFFVNQRLSRQVITNTNYINNSESILRNSNLMHKLMIDMQSGYRGYLLTGQESFLDPYYRGLLSIPPILREQYLLCNSKIQKSKLDSIAANHGAWVRYANALIATKHDTLPEGTKKYSELFEKRVKTETGKKLNDAISVQFRSFDDFEYSIRQQRQEALQESIADTRNISLALTITSITLALISSFYIISLITGRISEMVTMAESISKGDFRLIHDDKNDELRKLSGSLNAMSHILEKNFKELRRKNKELDQFAYVVSHDLKAPLRGIDNILTWTEEDHAAEITPELKKNIDLIRGRAKRLENMINGLLDYARIGKEKKALQLVDVSLMLRELTEVLVPAGFTVKIENDLPLIVTEPLLLEQVFSNLISNAVKYNDKDHGEISISSVDKPRHYEFTVKDNGIGIQPEYFEKIFTIFQTLRERDAFESTGVGLAIVKKIIEEQKATINVESVFGQGAAFNFTWPKNPEPV